MLRAEAGGGTGRKGGHWRMEGWNQKGHSRKIKEGGCTGALHAKREAERIRARAGGGCSAHM